MLKPVFQEYIVKMFEVKSIISIITLVALAVILVVISRKTAFNTRTLAYASLAIAASFVLSYIRIFRFPNGGTITVASMLPLFIFAYMAGPRAGIAAGLCYGIFQFIQEPYFVHWVQFLLDYPLAFALLGVSGIFKKNIYLGAAVGSFGRLVCHFLSGVIFFASYAPEGQSVYIYSFLYNISYILPDLAICLALLAIPNIKAAINRVRYANY